MNLPIARGAAARDELRARWQRLSAHPALARLRGLAPDGAVRLVPYVAYTVVLFVVFLAKTFPHELVLRRVIEPAATAPVAVEVRGVDLGWTLAYTIEELRLLRRGADPSLPLLTAAHVHAAPSLLGLLRGRPFPLGLRADVYGGTMAATVDLRPDGFALRASAAALDLARYAGLRLFVEGTPQGRVDGALELAGDAAKPTTISGTLDLKVAELALESGKIQGITVPDLHFPELHVTGTVKAGRLELAEVNARGREVSIQGTGNVLLAHPLAASLLNLDVVLTPAADLPDNLRLALNLIPGDTAPNGDRHVRILGTIAQPRLSTK